MNGPESLIRQKSKRIFINFVSATQPFSLPLQQWQHLLLLLQGSLRLLFTPSTEISRSQFLFLPLFSLFLKSYPLFHRASLSTTVVPVADIFLFEPNPIMALSLLATTISIFLLLVLVVEASVLPASLPISAPLLLFVSFLSPPFLLKQLEALAARKSNPRKLLRFFLQFLQFPLRIEAFFCFFWCNVDSAFKLVILYWS